MKIAIVGGHLTPALSVIEALPKDVEVIYIGRKNAIEGDNAVSLEYETINKMGIPFAELKTGRVQRSFSRYTIPSLGRVPFGLFRAVNILRRHKPDVVLAFGGYLSFPLVIGAKMLGIPSVIHEQTLRAGASNKYLGRFADKICISFETSSKYFPKEKTVLTGNPIRNAILSPRKKLKPSENLPLIYVTGGSLGSHFINQLVGENLSKLLEKYLVVHQTGSAEEFKDFEKLTILKEGVNNDKRKRYSLSKFFSPQDTGSIIKAASLIVSRAGINTVSELIILKKPAILIPIPKTSGNEQLENAHFFKNLGLGEVLEQKDLTPEKFLEEINDIMNNLDKYKINSGKVHYPRSAAAKIIEVIYASAKTHN
jgi:UDP-N-acetylglucosamine--N-acetylmuramyl-(pentapeptide) pyrophosphoryl-undecaprenol N-acetylglucosamine transferase